MATTRKENPVNGMLHDDAGSLPQARWCRGKRGMRGFTLIEVIVSLILVGILAAVGGLGIVQAVQGYMIVKDNAEMTQKAQLAMARITREIVEMTGLTAAASTTLLPVKNVDRNITIGLDASAKAIKISSTGGTDVTGGDILVDNVNNLTLTYYTGSTPASSWPLPVPGTSSDIRNLSAIDINLQIARPDGTALSFLNRVSPRNNKNQGGAAPGVEPLALKTNYGCFVATAAFGNAAHPMVMLLRDFRDRFLLTWSGGKWLVDQYYIHGPAAAGLIQDRPFAMWMVRMILLPVAALTFLIVYAPWAIPFLLLSSLIVTIALLAARRKGREPMRALMARQKGSVLLGLIAAMVVMATLGAAMVPMFSASYMNQAGADHGRKAYFLAESGFRYAAGQYLAADNTAAGETVLSTINNKTYTLLNNRGSFTTVVSPFWTVAQSVSGSTLTTQISGTTPDQLKTGAGGGYLLLGSNNFHSYASRASSGTTVTFNTLSGTPVMSGNNEVLPVALPAGTSFSNGGNLLLQGKGANVFPVLNGNFTTSATGSVVFNYEKRVDNELRTITLADPSKEWPTFSLNNAPDDITAASKIILAKYLLLTSTGNYGGSTRQITYSVPIGWLDGGGKFIKKQEINTFNSASDVTRFSFTNGQMGTHSYSDGAMKVDSVVDPTTTGSGLLNWLLGLVGWGNDGLWAVNAWDWSTTDANLAQAWHDAGGCLSYDLQVKVNNQQPYFMAGLGFRVRNNQGTTQTTQDVHTYGASLLRQRQTRSCIWFLGWNCGSWGQNDGIHPNLRPLTSYPTSETIDSGFAWRTEARYSDPAIVLWQRTGHPTQIGTFKRLAHRTITASDGITTGSGTSLRLKPWTTLMVRLIEGYELPFVNGRVNADGSHLKYGDEIKDITGLKTARVIGTPVITKNWGAAGTTTTQGYLILTNVVGQFTNDNLYLVGGGSDAVAQATGSTSTQKSNYIMIYYSDNKDPVAGNAIQADGSPNRIGNKRNSVSWPPDDWTTRKAGLPAAGGNDYFALIGNNSSASVTVPWTALDTNSANYYGGLSPSFFNGVAGSDLYQSIIRTWALISPTWTGTVDSFSPGDHITLITSSSAGTSTYYDDFAVQIDMKSGTGFLPPIQQ
ncbi:MAG: PilW family protein [Syntrophales bacterium]